LIDSFLPALFLIFAAAAADAAFDFLPLLMMPLTPFRCLFHASFSSPMARRHAVSIFSRLR